jgi:hypothetical protein
MARSLRVAGLAASLLALAGCGALRGPSPLAAPHLTADDYLATLPPEKTRAIASAEAELRGALRLVARAEQNLPLAEQELAVARAEAAVRAAAVARAVARLELVKRQHQAQLYAPPADGRAAKAPAPGERLDAAESAVEVARWEQERAAWLVDLRQREIDYANAFLGVARRQVEVRRAGVEVARAQAVADGTSGLVPGIADPRVARAEVARREAELVFARAYADAAERLAAVQVRQRSRSRFRAGAPVTLAPAQSGSPAAAPLALTPRPVESTPLPWPAPAAPDAADAPAGDRAGEPVAEPPAGARRETGSSPAEPQGDRGAAVGLTTSPLFAAPRRARAGPEARVTAGPGRAPSTSRGRARTARGCPDPAPLASAPTRIIP